MNRRAHRAAFEAKRQLPDLTDAECIAMDEDRERQKYDPAVQREQLRRDIQEQQQMLRILGSSL